MLFIRNFDRAKCTKLRRKLVWTCGNQVGKCVGGRGKTKTFVGVETCFVNI